MKVRHLTPRLALRGANNECRKSAVLTFVFTNPEGFSMKNEWAPLFQKSGIDKISYVPPHQPMKREEWPTLGEMLDSGRRVVTFIDSKADNGDDRVDYLLPEFPHVSLTYFG